MSASPFGRTSARLRTRAFYDRWEAFNTYAPVELGTGVDPRIDLVREGERYRTMDVNGDHLIDILKTTGRSMQTWLNLGFVPGGVSALA